MMKKIITLCIVALTTMSLTAQVVIDRPGYGPIPDVPKPSSFMMKYGIKAGLNMTAMSNEMSFDPKFSMGAGFRAGALLNMRWGQRTENSLPGTGVWALPGKLTLAVCAGIILFSITRIMKISRPMEYTI